MSVSLWRWTEACDEDYCPGDCDNCNKNPMELPETAKAYNTGYEAGVEVGMLAAIANMISCEECRKSVNYENDVYCVVHARHMPKWGFCCYGEPQTKDQTEEERLKEWQETIITERKNRWEGK